jgi:probable DNA metabolism protein
MSAWKLSQPKHLHLPSQVFAEWRESARLGLQNGVEPAKFDWTLPGLCAGDAALAVEVPTVPGHFLNMALSLALHRDEDKWRLLYSLLWRLNHGEPGLLSLEDDAEVVKARFMEKAVLRDMHKMQVFVRFKESHHNLVAWYEPGHAITESVAPYFLQRYQDQPWVIHTPALSVRWNLKELEFSAGLAQPPRFLVEDSDETWSRYRAAQDSLEKVHIVPLKPPRKSEVGDAPAKAPKPPHPAEPPETTQLTKLRAAAKHCLVCPFAKYSTQTVFGEGAKKAAIMIVGEQPGDQEDRQGHPFVGPAGALLDEILEELGIDRDQVYVTNAVKHFKFTQRGKVRLHAKPSASEVHACRPWLEKEIEAVEPQVIVALGATAAASVCGRAVKIGAEHGSWLGGALPNTRVLVSWHPSAILRSIDEESRHEKRAQLKEDLRKVRDFVKKPRGSSSEQSLRP